MSGTPLIWTTKGNLPLAQLRQEIVWRETEHLVVFSERYYLGDELVKEQSHIKVLTGATAEGAATT